MLSFAAKTRVELENKLCTGNHSLGIVLKYFSDGEAHSLIKRCLGSYRICRVDISLALNRHIAVMAFLFGRTIFGNFL